MTSPAGRQLRPAMGTPAAGARSLQSRQHVLPRGLRRRPGQPGLRRTRPPVRSSTATPGSPNGFTDKRLANLSPRGWAWSTIPTAAARRPSGSAAALLYDSVGTFIPYRMVAQNPPYGPQVTNHQRPVPVQQPVGQRPGRQSVSAAPPGKNVPFPLGQRRGVSAAASSIRRAWRNGTSACSTGSATTGCSRSLISGNKTSHLWIGNEINPAVYIPGTCGSAACSSTEQHPGAARPVAREPEGRAVLFQMILARRRHQRQLQRSVDFGRAPFCAELHAARQLHLVKVPGHRAGHFSVGTA